MRSPNTFFAALLVVSLISGYALSNVPHLINFQGTLTDSTGNPITGTRYIRFFLYADSTGGIPLWMESHSTVEITDGLFRITLGSEDLLPDSLFDGSVLWLAIQVNPDPMPFSQRQPLHTVSYSFHSLDADRASRADSADYAAGLSLPYSGSASSSSNVFSVTNTASTGLGAAIYGEKSSLGSSGYLGGTYGAFGEYGNGNKGYMGSSNYGVYGSHQSAGNWGDLGDVDYGVYGRHNSGNEGYIGSDQFGVYGKNNGSANWGYLGSGSLGAYGKHTSTNNYGQLGSSNYGVYGSGNGANRKGVQGNHSSGNYGYLGSDSIGVYGHGNDYAGYFDGNVKIGTTGTSISEIKVISGTTASSGMYTQISYPASYDTSNTLLLGAQIQSSFGYWYALGTHITSTEHLYCILLPTNINLYYTSSPSFWNRPYRIILMKM